MKIVYLLLKGMPAPAGIEKYNEEVGARLVSAGHEIIVYAMPHLYDTAPGEYRGMEVRTIPAMPIRGVEKMAGAAWASLAAGLCRGVDLVHIHAFGPGVFAAIPRLAGRKVVVQGHGIEQRRSRWGRVGRAILALTEKPSVRFPHAVTVVSRVQQEYLRQRYGIESTYIPPGVAPPRLLPARRITSELGLEPCRYLLFAARHVREKGAHTLIRAFRELDTDLRLVIAGDDPYEGAYKAELHDLAGDDPRILFPGFVRDELFDELFSNAWLYVQPSELEGLPITLLEAMAYGAPCLASDIPENREALRDHGFTFRDRDADDLRTVLRGLLDSPEQVEARRGTASEWIQQEFSWDRIAESTLNFYQTVLQGRPGLK